jgi:hypothetical protein
MKEKLIFTLLLFGFFVNVRKHKINPRLRTTNTNYLCTTNTNRNYLCTSKHKGANCCKNFGIYMLKITIWDTIFQSIYFV